MTPSIRQVHAASYGTYGHRCVHAELALGQGVQVSQGRIERLMRHTGLQGVHRRRLRGCTRRYHSSEKAATSSADLVERNFTPDAPDRLYVADVTQHRTSEGWLYLAVVIDCFSRRVVGWSMADHIRSELVVDALQIAIWNRHPAPGTIHHSDHGVDLHQLGLRPPATRSRPARIDEVDRRRSTLARRTPGCNSTSVSWRVACRRAWATLSSARAGSGAPDDIRSLQEALTDREQQIVELRHQLEERGDELAAARAANRELMSQLNTRA